MTAVDLMAEMAPIGDEGDSGPSFYVIGGSFMAPGDDYLPSRFYGMYQVKDVRFDANCESVSGDGSVNHCHVAILDAKSCSASVLEGASDLELPGDELSYTNFAYTTSDDGSITNPFWGQTEQAILEENNEGVVELFGARDFESNLDFSFRSLGALDDLQSFFGGHAIVVYGKDENSPLYCGILDTVSQEKSDQLEEAYFKRFEEACNSPGLSDEEFTNYDCKYISALKSKPSSAPELALQFWLLVAIVAVQL